MINQTELVYTVVLQKNLDLQKRHRDIYQLTVIRMRSVIFNTRL